jgi:REP element-mobilizing transposase RayT
MLRTAGRYRFEVIDYCLMSNHFHVFVLLRTPNLSAAMQYLSARYVERFNRRHDRNGHLVQAPYHAEPVLSEGHYLEVRRYFAMNPVKARICSRPEDWPWGGYGGRGRVVPEPDGVVRRMVEQAMDERNRRRAA